jgi:hypothetical protein
MVGWVLDQTKVVNPKVTNNSKVLKILNISVILSNEVHLYQQLGLLNRGTNISSHLFETFLLHD